jgi:hypothetical protein
VSEPLARSSTTFKPGVSGNPSGRPKRDVRDIDIEKLARAHAPEAIATLVGALKHPKLCVQAASVLLDRGFGRPRQNISGDKDAPLLVDFRWSDGNSIVSTALQPVIEAAVEVEAEQALAWQVDD